MQRICQFDGGCGIVAADDWCGDSYVGSCSVSVEVSVGHTRLLDLEIG